MCQQPTVAQFWTRAERTSDLCINQKKKTGVSKTIRFKEFALWSRHSLHATVQLWGFVNICIPQVNRTGLFSKHSQDIAIFIPVERYTVPACTKISMSNNKRARQSCCIITLQLCRNQITSELSLPNRVSNTKKVPKCSLTQGDLTHSPSVHADQRFLQNCQVCGYTIYDIYITFNSHAP